ncbi:RICIN domain-containing protein [Nonomuraea deserti]|uniref:RICIN domain-containing protein n=1 Tax=Nonomuraea deserti TaxID=1848322 RepID=UPI0034E0B031
MVWYQIIVEHSGQCLDVAHASTAHAADVVQATCGGPGARGNQTWRFRPVAFH